MAGNRPLRVLLVSPHFPPRHVGGVEIYTRDIANWLATHGFEPEVVAVEDITLGQPLGVDAETDRQMGYAVHRLRLTFPTHEAFVVSHGSPQLVQWFDRHLAARAHDVMHLHSGYLLGGGALAAAHARRLPTVLTVHDFWFVCPRVTLSHPDGQPCSGPESAGKCAWCVASNRRRFGLSDRVTRGALGAWFTRVSAGSAWDALGVPVGALVSRRTSLARLFDHPDVVLLPRLSLRHELEMGGMKLARATASPYGIDAATPPVPSDLVGRPVRLGFLGQVAPHKGVHVLIEAFRLVTGSNVELRIHGATSGTRDYGARIAALAAGDPRIALCGRYERESVGALLADLDALVVPSLWQEVLPFVMLEARAAGVPVIASRLGGMREMVRDGVDGLHFATGDVGDLAATMQRLIDDTALLAKLKAARVPVRARADEMDTLGSLYRQLARAARGSPPAGA